MMQALAGTGICVGVGVGDVFKILCLTTVASSSRLKQSCSGLVTVHSLASLPQPRLSPLGSPW